MNGFKTFSALLLLAGSSFALPQSSSAQEAAPAAVEATEYVYEQPVEIPDFASKSGESVGYEPSFVHHHQPVETVYRCKFI